MKISVWDAKVTGLQSGFWPSPFGFQNADGIAWGDTGSWESQGLVSSQIFADIDVSLFVSIMPALLFDNLGFQSSGIALP